MSNPDISIHPIEAGPAATFGYLVIDNASKQCVVIDVPHNSADFFVETAEQNGAELQAILLTHSHWDHTADAVPLHKRTGAPVYIHADDEYRLVEPMRHTLWPLPFTIEGMSAQQHFTHGDTIQFGALSFEVRHTPGHSEGGVCFIDSKRKLAFVGDTLFAGSIGRTDLPGGDLATLLASIRRELFSLDDTMRIFPGHGPDSSIGHERQFNPFLR